MARVLVTGATGFVGRHLVDDLRRDAPEIRVLVRPTHKELSALSGIEVVRGSLADRAAVTEAVAGADTIFHLAGKAHDLKQALDDDREHQAVTVEGTRAVLDAARAAGVGRIVFASSLAVYGPGNGTPRDESDPCEPTTAYGRAKLEAERLVLSWAEQTGGRAIVLRPAMVYGPGCKGNLPRLMRAIDRGWMLPPPETGAQRSVLHISNLVQALRLAADKTALSGVFICSDAATISPREMFNSLSRAMGRRVPTWSVPVGALKAAAWLGDAAGALLMRRVPFDSAALDRLIGPAVFSCARLMNELDYRPQMTFERALPGLVAAYRREV
jgi:UDP-glucose 4-epimerase